MITGIGFWTDDRSVIKGIGPSPAPPVPVKNSIRPTVTEFGRRRDTPKGRVGAQPSSLTIGSRDDPRPRCLGFHPRPPRQISRRLAGECRPPASTGGTATISRSPPAPPAGPALLGRALTTVGQLAGPPPPFFTPHPVCPAPLSVSA